ncbi:MAG: hypothetical protein COA43_07475 [Robiginitomaculum sp.]|nr:MAG: hypothetical protein COA43_07475 [Robiginitomaculum sp.]
MTQTPTSPPLPEFGAYALPEQRETLRKKADKFGMSTLGRWAISYYRKRAFKDLPEPFDIHVMPGVNARVWPRSNRCEKRAFAGVQIWDAAEHKALASALYAKDTSNTEPFVFLDIGANVGFYSLILSARAKDADKDIRILAVEPDTTNRERFQFNQQASSNAFGATDIDILNCAISDQEGAGDMVGGSTNRGEVRLGSANTNAKTSTPSIAIKTLHSICELSDITYIDALKLDIEGHDERALRAFFTTAPQSLWPKLMVLETGKAPTTPLLELCAQYGYTLITRSGINSVLTREQ